MRSVPRTTVDQTRADGKLGASRLAYRVKNTAAERGRLALPADFRERIGRYRSGSGTFRMNVALSELPRAQVTAKRGGSARSSRT